jgi:hypothetical protein
MFSLPVSYSGDEMEMGGGGGGGGGGKAGTNCGGPVSDYVAYGFTH